uniref:hypothetical protein n=1 Tax=Pseudomonas viridiflava TaxID=33069 RepID=UPI000F05C842
GRIFFSGKTSKEPQILARLSGPSITRKNNMDVKVPQRLDPQDIVKLLRALRQALKTQVA